MLSSYLNEEDWTKQFISKLLQIAHSQWIYQNISLHGRQHGYLHAMNAAEIMQEIETLSNLAPEEVAKESHFLLKINFTDLSRFHIEAQKYWILAVNAARMAWDLALARGARTKQAKQKVNTKILSRKKLGIVNIEQQIRRDGMHWCITQTSTDPEHNTQPSIDCFVMKQPHPASIVAALQSNKRLRTHPLAALIQSCVRGYTLSLLLAFWKDLGHSKLIPKGLGTPVPDLVAPLRPCCGKTRQSKRLLSILIVQSRIGVNSLSCLFTLLRISLST
jgi:hypothetical protein